MELIEAIEKRMSVRAYRPDSVPRQVLEQVLTIASRAPSSVNCQPWEFAVIGGAVLDKIRQANIEKMRAGEKPRPDYDAGPTPRQTAYHRRQVDLAKQIFTLMDISREDKAKRQAWIERGFRFFDAPAVIIVMMDRMLPVSGPLLDLGSVMQTICLAALEYGLGTCIEDQGIQYTDAIREFAGIPESKRMIIAIAIGYPDWDFPANRLRSEREPIIETTRWYGL